MIEVISAGPKTDWSLFFDKKTLTVLENEFWTFEAAVNVAITKDIWVYKRGDFLVRPRNKRHVDFASRGTKGKIIPISIGIATKLAKGATLIKRPKNAPRVRKGEFSMGFFKNIYNWFLGSPVKDKSFYAAVEKLPLQTIEKCYRVSPVPGAKVGAKVKVGNLSFYSGSLKPASAAEGWTSWADENRVLDKHKGGKVSVIEFTNVKVYGTPKTLKVLLAKACENLGRGEGVVDTLMHFKEVWIQGGQTGKVVQLLDVDRLEKKYVW